MQAFHWQVQAMADSELIFDVTEADYDERVIAQSRSVPVMVDFWADWCPPCKALTPVLEKLVQQYNGRFVLAKVEVDDNMHLAGRYQLKGFPTVLLFKGGKEVGRFASFRTPDYVSEFVDERL
jgi:putative thioredoxin